MSKLVGSTGIESMAWAGRIKPVLSAQNRRGKVLEKFIERCHSLLNMAEEVQRPLAAQALSSKGQALRHHRNMHIVTNEGLESLKHELIHITQQIQPQRLLQRRAANRDLSLLPPALTTTSSDGWTAMPTVDKTTPMSTNIQRAEVRTKGGEPASTRISTQKSSESSTGTNLEAVADKVYRLMQRDLVLERERANRLGG